MDRLLFETVCKERFGALPIDCGAAIPGVDSDEAWREWDMQPTTPDQLRIEDYLDACGVAGKRILHIGCGNSRLARRFHRRARAIVGTTIARSELEHGVALGLARYEVRLENKFDGHPRTGEVFDFVVDNNPSTFGCCMNHLARMLEDYAGRLGPEGQIVTDRVGLGWLRSDDSHPRWSFDFDDLAALGPVFGLRAWRMDANVIVLARDRPRPPGRAGMLRVAVRRAALRMKARAAWFDRRPTSAFVAFRSILHAPLIVNLAQDRFRR